MFLKNNVLKRAYGLDFIVHDYDKIMLFSCCKLGNSIYELTFFLNYVYDFDGFTSILPIKTILNYEQYNQIKKLKFGTWLNYINIFNYPCYVYIYKNKINNRLIYKSTKHDNNLSCGYVNQYNHELIFKGILRNKSIIDLGGK